ncbi:hypothetical protein BG003_004656, partial [Podila horticola]
SVTDNNLNYNMTSTVIITLQQRHLEWTGSVLPHLKRSLYTLERTTFLQRNYEFLKLRACLYNAGDVLINEPVNIQR